MVKINGLTQNKPISSFLREFFIHKKKLEYIAYFIILILSLFYGLVNQLYFGRAEEDVIVETIAITVILVLALPIVYAVARKLSVVPSLKVSENTPRFGISRFLWHSVAYVLVGVNPMKFSTLLTINAIVGLVYGICFVLVPSTVLSIYGIDEGSAQQLMSQFFGVALIALGLLSWLIRNVTDASAQRAVILSALPADIIGVIVALMGTLSGAMNNVGWTAVAIYFLLVLGFASLQFKKPAIS